MAERERKTFDAAEFKVLDDATGTAEMIVSVFNNTDAQHERVLPGFFADSIARRRTADGRPRAKGVWSHDWTSPVGKSLDAAELLPGDPRLPPSLTHLGGLWVKGQFNLDTQAGREAYSNLKFGAIDEFSIGYRVLEDAYDAKTGVRDLVRGEWYEWSPVLVGANPETTLLSIKALADLEAEQKSAVGIHHTATTGASWDGPANEARLDPPLTLSVGRRTYAWLDPEGDPTTKAAWRFIHHQVSADGTPGAANLVACSAGIAVLNGGRGGTTIPAADQRGVYQHLAAHLKDGEREPPPLKSVDDPEPATLFEALAALKAGHALSTEDAALLAELHPYLTATAPPEGAGQLLRLQYDHIRARLGAP